MISALLDRDDVRGAAVGDQQVRPFFRRKKTRELGGTCKQSNQIVFVKREHRRDQIVTK